jgi:hypothetical protein
MTAAVATARKQSRITLPRDILDAISSEDWWARWFQRGDWTAWKSFLSAAFGLPMTADQLVIYQQCTGRSEPPTQQATESWSVCGRRGGKTRIMATVAAWLACFSDLRPYLGPGEIATVMLIAANRKQARTAMRYLRSLIVDHPVLARLVVKETEEAIELSNRCVIEITTASFRTSRGYTIAAVICDELAFWIDDSDSANPAAEIIASLRPGMATIPNSLLMTATSPYARRGVVWETHRKHWAKDGDTILVWQAPTRTMNASVPQSVVDEAMERDPASASAEFMAEFRADVEGFVTREAVEANVVLGQYELPPVAGIVYSGFCDPSGGAANSMTLAVGHRDGDGNGVLDAIREVRPPFSPDSVVAEFSALLKAYGVHEITGDRYGGDWPASRFSEYGVTYLASEKTKSDIYREFLPLLNSRRVELLDHSRLVAQLVGLERRTARSGRDLIAEPPGGHDDVCNSAAGVLVQVAGEMDEIEVWIRCGRD